MKTSYKIAIAALALSLIVPLVTGTYFVTSGLAKVDTLSRRLDNLSGRIGDASTANRSGIYAEIDAEIGKVNKQLGAKLDERLDRATAIPVGTILPWIYTPTHPNIPKGWVLCDGTNQAPNLTGKFLRGVASRAESRKSGGRVDIPDDGSHGHGGKTGAVQSNRIRYENGDDNNGVWFNHSHEIPDGESHNHGGDNLPPFYTVMYIMKVK